MSGNSSENEDEEEECSHKTLDPNEENFDPLKALYAKDLKNIDVKCVKYDNLAMFETALKNRGILAVGTKTTISGPSTSADRAVAGTSQTSNLSKTQISENSSQRRFLPHQMPIKGRGAIKSRHSRNLYKQMEESRGPLAALYKIMKENDKIKVYTRKEHGIRGSIIGRLIAFDKHWNLLLADACEMWKRRKYKFSHNEANLGISTNCSERLRRLRIKLPETEVKSLDRKYVEIKRKCNQIMIRGEHIVLVSKVTEENQEKSNEFNKINENYENV